MIIHLNDLCKISFYNNGIFCRYDILIKYMAVHEWHKYHNINDLYWRMQFAKLWFHIKNNSNIHSSEYMNLIDSQKKRLTEKVDVVGDSTNYPFNAPIVVNDNYSLVDGSHRLAVLMYFRITDVKVIVDDNAKIVKPFGKEWWLDQLFTENEWKHIIDFCEVRGVMR